MAKPGGFQPPLFPLSTRDERPIGRRLRDEGTAAAVRAAGIRYRNDVYSAFVTVGEPLLELARQTGKPEQGWFNFDNIEPLVGLPSRKGDKRKSRNNAIGGCIIGAIRLGLIEQMADSQALRATRHAGRVKLYRLGPNAREILLDVLCSSKRKPRT